MPAPLPLHGPIRLIHVDDHLIVVEKPAGLLSVPGKTEPDCLEARLIAQFSDALTVHRLDMATSGVIVFARGKANLAHLSRQFEKRQTAKRYVALVSGRMAAMSGVVDAPLRCDWPNRPLQMICREEGREAITQWRVDDEGESHTRLGLTPITGRSHQLRVHLQSLGHPIIGDEWYGGASAGRLMLHASELTLHHPANGVRTTFSSLVPF
jgi:tRNA pseudouridine32 synthase/23S rRNA pseudouridine746 synthase